ncbi:hypothetical protein DKX38_002674 [Salix brachista]|uniref:Uncharacterized protein n=1 Tax=Salix brachista TaxID=2182728 RepID=A0A5N5NQP4_9ROSI|nr:hypothetical protein DKX38_002674 [Salix brachista]
MVLTNFSGPGVGFENPAKPKTSCCFFELWDSYLIGIGSWCELSYPICLPVCLSGAGMPMNILGLGAGAGCGVGLGLGWGFGTAFGSQYRSSTVTFQGMELAKKESDGN